MNKPKSNILFTFKVRDIAGLLGLTERHVYRLVERGVIRRREGNLTIGSIHDYLAYLRRAERTLRALRQGKRGKASASRGSSRRSTEAALNALNEDVRRMLDRAKKAKGTRPNAAAR